MENTLFSLRSIKIFLLVIPNNPVNIEDNSAAIKRKLVQEAAATPAPAPLRVGDVERINAGGEQGKGEMLCYFCVI